MTHTFYGQWTITVGVIRAGYAQRFIVSGSSGSDGIYPGVVGTIVPVAGQRWTVAMEWNDNAGSGWQPSDVRKSAWATVREGLVVQLSGDDGPPGNQDHDYDDLILICVNRDPNINPYPPGPPPYDFSLPRKVVVVRDP